MLRTEFIRTSINSMAIQIDKSTMENLRRVQA